MEFNFNMQFDAAYHHDESEINFAKPTTQENPIKNNLILNRKRGVKKGQKYLFRQKPFKDKKIKNEYVAKYEYDKLQKFCLTHKNVSVEKLFNAGKSETDIAKKMWDLVHDNNQSEIYNTVDFLFDKQNYKQFRSKAIPIFLKLAEWASATQDDLKEVLNFYIQEVIAGSIIWASAIYEICMMVREYKNEEESDGVCQDQITFKLAWQRLKKGYESKTGGFENISNLKIGSAMEKQFKSLFKNENVNNRKIFDSGNLITRNSKYKKLNFMSPKLENNDANDKIIGLEEHN